MILHQPVYGHAPLHASLQMFYESRTCADLHDKRTEIYLCDDLYIADEFMREKEL